MSSNVTSLGGALAVRDDPRVLKLGGVLAILGGLGYLVALLLHGDLPDDTTETALEHIAHRPEWRVLKLALVASVLCWVGALTALCRSLGGGLSELLARWSVSVMVIGVAVVVVEYAIIGHALKGIADTWTSATGPDAAAQVELAAVMLAITGGLFHSFVAWLLGLPFVLMGLAVALGSGYPRWLGWTAVFLGTGALVAGTTRFAGVALVPYPLLYGGFVVPLTLWLVVTGGVMWRRARAMSS